MRRNLCVVAILAAGARSASGQTVVWQPVLAPAAPVIQYVPVVPQVRHYVSAPSSTPEYRTAPVQTRYYVSAPELQRRYTSRMPSTRRYEPAPQAARSYVALYPAQPTYAPAPRNVRYYVPAAKPERPPLRIERFYFDGPTNPPGSAPAHSTQNADRTDSGLGFGSEPGEPGAVIIREYHYIDPKPISESTESDAAPGSDEQGSGAQREKALEMPPAKDVLGSKADPKKDPKVEADSKPNSPPRSSKLDPKPPMEQGQPGSTPTE